MSTRREIPGPVFPHFSGPSCPHAGEQSSPHPLLWQQKLERAEEGWIQHAQGWEICRTQGWIKTEYSLFLERGIPYPGSRVGQWEVLATETRRNKREALGRWKEMSRRSRGFHSPPSPLAESGDKPSEATLYQLRRNTFWRLSSKQRRPYVPS